MQFSNRDSEFPFPSNIYQDGKQQKNPNKDYQNGNIFHTEVPQLMLQEQKCP